MMRAESSGLELARSDAGESYNQRLFSTETPNEDIKSSDGFLGNRELLGKTDGKINSIKATFLPAVAAIVWLERLYYLTPASPGVVDKEVVIAQFLL